MPIDTPAAHLFPQNAQGRTTTLSSTGLLSPTPLSSPNSSFPAPPPSPAPPPFPPNLPISLLPSRPLPSQSFLLYPIFFLSSFSSNFPACLTPPWLTTTPTHSHPPPPKLFPNLILKPRRISHIRRRTGITRASPALSLLFSPPT
jgi:hypothetical protein